MLLSYELTCRISKATHGMRNTQVSVWEIQHLNIFCQYQDTVELQVTLLLEVTKSIMDNHSLQEIRTMMMPLLTTVHNYIKVPGGMLNARNQIPMVYTMVGHIPPMLMVWTGSHAWRGHYYSLKFAEMKLREIWISQQARIHTYYTTYRYNLKSYSW